MDDYISREALIDRLSKNLSACNPGTFSEMCYADAIETVKHLPAADVAPVRHGRCKKSDGKDEWYTYYYTCVECGANMMVADSDYHDVSPNYCPNCGAKMDEEERT